MIITTYNTIIFLISIPYVNDTKVVLIIIMTNVLFYIYLYNKLINNLFKKGSVKKN